VEWDGVMEGMGVNEMWEFFMKRVVEIRDRYIPMRVLKAGKRKND
jgi:hypothetical protein